jgi:uncharacterized protein (DUF849 family)
MIVQACLNGARPAGFHPNLPIVPDAIIADGAAVIAAGAHELHVHVRNADGLETLAPQALDRVVGGLRARLPGTFIGVSTGAWIEKDDARRLAMIDGWSELPDYASVNLGEPDAPAVFQRLARRGVAVEAGLAAAPDAERLIDLGLARHALRILIELDDGDAGEAECHARADKILARLAEAGIRKPILLHGAGRTMWSFVKRAARDGLSTRIGLEDGDMLPDGRKAQSNAELVAAALDIMNRRGPRV